MSDAVRLVDGDLPRAAALGELVAEPTLPGSRLGDDADDLRVSRNCLLERGLKRGHLALTSDELAEAAGAGHVEAGSHAAHALELEDVRRIVQPFDAGFTQVAEFEVAGDEPRRSPSEKHLSRIGHLFHARSEPHGLAL